LDDLFIEEEIAELRKQIAYHNNLYYKKIQPEISDFKFDKLVKRLQYLEQKYPQYKVDNSPTKIIGSDISGNNKIIPHKIRMYSLENAYSLDEIEQFINNIKKIDGRALAVTTELKIDGFSINLL
jgi:DNA ligase (NAD+)